MVRFSNETLTSQKLDIANNLGKLKTIELPTDRWIQQIVLDLKGTFTTTDAGFAAQQDNPMGLIKKIDLVGNGGKNGSYNTGFGIDGSHGFSRLYHEDTLEHAAVPPRTILASGTLTAAAFRATATIDFRLNPRDSDECIKILPNGVPSTSLLPAWAFNALNLNVQLGTHVDLRTDAGTNNTFPAATLEVTIRSAQLDQSDPNIQLANTLELGSGELIPTGLTVQNNFAVNPTLGVLVRRYIPWTIDTANQVRINDVVTGYRVKQTSPTPSITDDVSWDASQVQDSKDFGIGSQEAGFPFRTGMTVIDFDNNRDLANARNLAGLQSKDSFKLMFDVATATNRKMIVTEKYVR